MRLNVITPDVTLWSGHVTSINIAEKEGAFSILSGHSPLITVVKNILVTITVDGGELVYVAADFGTLKVLNNDVSLILDYGVVSDSKEEAITNLANLRAAMVHNSGSLGDDTIAKLETQLMRMTQDLQKL